MVKEMELTAVWAKVLDGQVSFLTIVLPSKMQSVMRNCLKCGKEYSYCVNIKISPLFGFAPILTEKEIMEICISMKPVKT
jgi:hypothetical protein